MIAEVGALCGGRLGALGAGVILAGRVLARRLVATHGHGLLGELHVLEVGGEHHALVKARESVLPDDPWYRNGRRPVRYDTNAHEIRCQACTLE
eukprot:2904019-Prymnesium_polylepis.1